MSDSESQVDTGKGLFLTISSLFLRAYNITICVCVVNPLKLDINASICMDANMVSCRCPAGT